jgi:hypothetical protein
VPPAATAFLTIVSTASLFSNARATKTSVVFVASEIALGVKVLNLSYVSNIAYMFGPIIMQVEESSVNWGLKVKPSLVKNSIEAGRFFTGRLTKILVTIVSPLLVT